ncbi:MAG: division/cell wall cluster transcriptional repressor MraZ [Pseudomonadota bacterium]
MFTSTYESGVDAKGRVSVPAPFRAALGGRPRLFVWPAIDGGGYLEAGGEELMAQYRQILARMSPQDPARKAITHALFTKSADLKMDEPGRVKLPEPLMRAAGVTDKIVFAGALDRFHIWNPDRFAEFDAAMSADAAANQSALDAPFQAALEAGALGGLGGGGGE